MSTPLNTLSAVLLCTAISTMTAASEQRHADSHIHGKGALNFAIEGKDIHLELEMPAADILGFESIHTDKQKQQLEQSLNALESASLWQFTKSAQCQLITAKATSGEEHESDDDHHEEHESDNDHHEDHESDNDHHEDHDNDRREEKSGHLDISVSYHYRCNNPKTLSTLKTSIFGRFEHSEEIAVQGFTDRGQVSLKMTRHKNEVSF